MGLSPEHWLLLSMWMVHTEPLHSLFQFCNDEKCELDICTWLVWFFTYEPRFAIYTSARLQFTTTATSFIVSYTLTTALTNEIGCLANGVHTNYRQENSCLLPLRLSVILLVHPVDRLVAGRAAGWYENKIGTDYGCQKTMWLQQKHDKRTRWYSSQDKHIFDVNHFIRALPSSFMHFWKNFFFGDNSSENW